MRIMWPRVWKVFVLFTMAVCLGEGHPQAGANNPPAIQLNGAEAAMRYHKADTMRKYMNLSVNPCDNFYEFSCGSWGILHPAGPDVLETNPMGKLKADIHAELAQIFNTYNANDTKTEKKVKDFYNSCMNLPLMDPMVYGHKIREIIQEFGEMPALQASGWGGFRTSWSDVITQINSKYGIEILLSSTFDEENRVAIAHPDLGMEQTSYYLDANMHMYRLSYVASIANTLVKYFGVDQAAADLAATEILDFEVELARAIVKNKEPHVTTVSRLEQKYFYNLPIASVMNTTVAKGPKDVIVELDAAYNKQLASSVKSVPEHVLANYIFYSLIKSFIVTSPVSQMQRAEKCVTMTKSQFPDFVDNIIYRRYDMHQTEFQVTNLFHDLKNIFKSNLNSHKYFWLKVSVRREVVRKLDSMKIAIESFAGVHFDMRYAAVTSNNMDYVGNLKSTLQKRAVSKYFATGKIPDLEDSPVTYSLHSNTIHVSVALLKPNYFWSPSYPVTVNFGALGFLLAREILHAFDMEMIDFDKNLNPAVWSGEEDRKTYNKRVHCFKSHYDNYLYYGRPLPAVDTQAENIDDVGGMRLVYDVYSTWLNNPFRPQPTSVISELLPPLNYTPEQLLFISYGQLWCSDILPVYRNTKVYRHAPERFRVFSTLSNSNEFSTAFACPRGSAMNPDKKCELY